MKKKVDIILVVDCSGSLAEQRMNINNALNTMIKAMKMSPDLMGCEMYFSLVPFSRNVIPEKAFEFKPLRTITSQLELGNFENVTNPGPALKNITVKALARYEAWKSEGVFCMHPLIFFFTDGYPYHPDDAIRAEVDRDYKDAASFIKAKESDKKLLIVGGAFGANADINNMNLLTANPERILKISSDNVDKLGKFFSEIIPMTAVTALTKSADQLKPMFMAFNSCE